MNGDGFFELLSQEGTTQGCPLAMAMYALALYHYQSIYNHFASKFGMRMAATISRKCATAMCCSRKVPCMVIFPNPPSILVTKPDRYEQAKKIFRGSGVQVQIEGSKDTGIEINCEGTRHLGAAVGNPCFKQSYIKHKVDNWIYAVKKLAGIVATQPHAAYDTFTHCLQGHGPSSRVPCMAPLTYANHSKM